MAGSKEGDGLVPVNFFIQRGISFIILLFGISLVAFGLMMLVPGDTPEMVLASIGVEAPPEAVEALRLQLQLHEPAYIQYGRWLARVVQLDLGISYRTGLPVVYELSHRLAATAELTLASLGFALLFAVPLGILTALYPRSWLDFAGRMAVLTGSSIPNFWLGLILAYLFGVRLQWLPIAGAGGLEGLVLPAATLGFGMAAAYTRLLRGCMLDALAQGFIRVARAKGLKERWLIGRHALRHALLPVLTWFGISVGHLLGGSVVVETIFSWPGLGRFAVESIQGRDYPVIQGYVLFSALVVVTINLVVDCLYSYLDPRIRLGGGLKE
jgi:ABC-type dipeptide/oligopeptide/nickel transport system permease component